MAIMTVWRHDLGMVLPANLHDLDADALRQLLIAQNRELVWRQAKIDQLTHELSLHKRWRFGVKTERLPAEQAQLFEETVEADLAAMTEELAQLSGKPSAAKGQAKRKPLPPELPRTEIRHEPDSTTCACGCQMKRIGEDVAEKLDYTPGTFRVERHIRGKWVCQDCETLVQAPVPAHVIDKGIPPPGCSPRCWWPSTRIICRCTARKASSVARASRFPNPRWPTGSARWACSSSPWSMR